jgi:acyl-CoA synthetase (AMP-forming)/AMP-acid ligase II
MMINDNFLGYFKNDAATKKKYVRDVFATGDLWIRSGDLLVRDEKNWMWFVDRIGDTYRWKGVGWASWTFVFAFGL